MQQILLVEDSVMFGKMTKKKIEAECGVEVVWTQSLAETLTVLENFTFSLALLDLNLPDAPNGQVVDHVVEHGITSLVFTSNESEQVHDQVWEKEVADYILKDNPNSINYIIKTIKRIEKNDQCLALVVDDSRLYRNQLAELLQIQKFRVLTAPDATEALDIIEKYPDIQLVITDFEMPVMNGCVLCQKIRAQFNHDEMAIIGLSSTADKSIGAKFIKNGADDFIVKDAFMVEEFYCRVNQCIDAIDNFKKIKDAAIKDYLTGLYNRRYFFEAGEKIFSKKSGALCCAMLDIDFFKKVNDTYGHAVGDLAIKHISTILQKQIDDTGLVARFGGEEFCILTTLDSEEAAALCEKIRATIANTPLLFNNKNKFLTITVSIGLATGNAESVDQLVNRADELLYRAKEDGRNCLRR